MTPISVGLTGGLESKHFCNQMPFNSLLAACAEDSCEYHGMCKKVPSTKDRCKAAYYYVSYIARLFRTINLVCNSIILRIAQSSCAR